MTERSLCDLLKDVINAGQSVQKIVREPDGSLHLILTEAQSQSVDVDPLEAARARRHAAKGKKRA